MNISKDINYIFCNISSIVYRILITASCAYIIYKFKQTIDDKYLYMSLSCYALLSVLFFTKFKSKRNIRLFLDYGIILLVTIKSNTPPYVILSALTLPIVNAPNHTGTRRTALPHIITVFCFLSISYIENNKLFNIIPLSFFIIIGLIESLKTKTLKITENLHSIIDDIYSEKIPFNKIHRAYIEIIKIINNKMPFVIKVNKIICTKNENKPVVVNGSEFINDILIDITSKTEFSKSIWQLRQIQLNDQILRNNIAIKTKHEYIFIINFENKIDLKTLLLAHQVLHPLFNKISQFIAADNELNKLRIYHARKLKSNTDFIESADLALHFIKNKIQPISTTLEAIQSAISNDKPQETKLQILELLENEIREAIESRKLIIQKSKQLLNQKRKIDFRKLDEISVAKLISSIKQISDANDLKIPISNDLDNNHFRETILVNEDGLFYIIDEIITNITKRNFNNPQIVISDNISEYIAIFSNTVPQDQIHKAETASRALIDDDAELTFERTSSGLISIKRICKQMKINLGSSCIDNTFYITIGFAKSIKIDERHNYDKENFDN